MEIDLFGNEIVKPKLLRDEFIEPPFSILDSKTGNWQKRKKKWQRLGIKSEIGRNKDGKVALSPQIKAMGHKTHEGVSIFDPALCELMYKWFCPEGGDILDPFAGGSVRGIVANFLNFKYTGIDIRQEQIDSNREQAINILEINNQPNWYVGDSNKVLDGFTKEFDFLFSCPPYTNLEVYSDLEGDISNMDYNEFLKSYKSIVSKSVNLLKPGSLAVFVVGDVRDKKSGNYYGFVPDTIRIFKECGMSYYNEIIYLQGMAGACLTAAAPMLNSKKVKKIHQNVLVFKK